MKKNSYILGIDVGVANIGWSLVDLENENIVDMGVRNFPTAKDAAARREKRGSRRTHNRKKQRIKEIQNLLLAHGVSSTEQTATHVWTWRADALDRLLSGNELYHVLLHLSRRRGYRSSRLEVAESAEEEEKVTLKVLHENAQLMREKNYRTLGEMFSRDPKFIDQKRNRKNHYLANVYRSDVEQEIRTIFSSQRTLGNPNTTESLEELFLTVWGRQLPYSTLELMVDKVGFCPLEPNEKRSPKASYSFQYFRLLTSINNIRILGSDIYRALTEEERDGAIGYCMTHKKISYHQLRNAIEKCASAPGDFRFAGLLYDSDETVKLSENVPFISMQELYDLRKAAGMDTPIGTLDTLAYGLTYLKEESYLKSYFQNTYRIQKTNELIPNGLNQPLSESIIENVKHLHFSGFGSYSLVALTKLIPYLENGWELSKAIQMAGYSRTQQGDKPNQLPPIPEIANNTVRRSLSQCRHIVNSLIKRYGVPKRITVEFARDLKMDEVERRKHHKQANANHNKNVELTQEIMNLGLTTAVKPHDLVKFKLWKEQGGICVYSGKSIHPHQLMNGEAETDHIIPLSRSLDDSYHNKVVVFQKENQRKQNQIPSEYMGMGSGKWKELNLRVESTFKHFSKKKKQLLLKESFTLQESEEWRTRHLNDTSYVAKFFHKILSEHIETQVFATNGRMTSVLRKRWGLTKEREHSDTHHAMDATIIALTNPQMISRITNYYQKKQKAKKLPFPAPWKEFREDLLTALDQCVVSRMPNRSANGQLHEETVRKVVGMTNKGMYITSVKQRIDMLPFDKNGDFPMHERERNKILYQKLKKAYLGLKNKTKPYKFTEPILIGDYEVKGVKVLETVGRVRQLKGGGVVYNGSMFQTALYKKEDRMLIVPIYKMDLRDSTFVKKAIRLGHGYEKWTPIDDSHQLIANLHLNDLVELEFASKKKIPLKSGLTQTFEKGEKAFLYYKGVNTNSGVLKFDLMDNSNEKVIELSVSTAPPNITKIEIDPTGRMQKSKTCI